LSRPPLSRDGFWFGFFGLPTLCVFVVAYANASAILITIFLVLSLPTSHFLLNLLDRLDRH
jgi:hypothetical protein